jgi:hemolysin activation/secretion protein
MNPWKFSRSALACASMLCCLSFTVRAQSPAVLPAGAPSAIELERQRSETLRLQRERELLLTPTPRVLPEPPKPEELTASDARFVLRAVDFSSTALLDMAQLQAIAATFVGKTVSFNDLGEMVNQVNALYVQRNQVFARAVLPPQRVLEGRVRIDLVEARLDALILQGQQRLDESWVQSVLGVSKGELLDAQALDERIQKFHRASDARLALTAQPGSQPSTSVLQLQVNEPAALSGSATLSNEGSDSTGRNQVQAELRWFSPLGRGDRASLSLTRGLGVTNAGLAWSVPVSARWGTRLQTSLSRSRTHVISGPFAIFDIRGRNAQESLSIGQPVWSSGAWVIDAQLGLTRSKSENLISGVSAGSTKLNQSNLSVATSYRRDGSDASFSLAWQNASAKAASGATTDDAILQWSGSYVQRFPQKAALLMFRINGQSSRSATPLGSQGMSLGGPAQLRAFASGALSGPSGYASSLELHHAFNDAWGAQMFVEHGEVWGVLARSGLSNVGTALEWRFSAKSSLQSTVATALGPVPVGQSRNRVYLRLNTQF